jgi:hypothetical protein
VRTGEVKTRFLRGAQVSRGPGVGAQVSETSNPDSFGHELPPGLTHLHADGDGRPEIGVWRCLAPQIQELSAIEVNLPANGDAGEFVPVTLESLVTETGLLQLWCVARDGRRWKLEFNVRERVP